jgi:chromosome partitioning protein
MSKIISVINQKGGVSKTTIAFNLAKGLPNKGIKILAIDNDTQGNLTSAFLEDSTKMTADVKDFYNGDSPNLVPQIISKNLHLIGANIRLSKVSDGYLDVISMLKEGLETIKKDYDFIIIDCLPLFSYLNHAALNASDLVLIPTKPAPFALEGLRDLFESVEKTKRRFNNNLRIVGILLSLVEGRKAVMGTEIEEVLREDYHTNVFDTLIH